MPFTTEEFLAALNLPEKHPYVIDDDNVQTEELKPWSVADYFGSVSSKKSTFNLARSLDECSRLPSFLTADEMELQRKECDSSTDNIGHYNSKSFNADKVNFFQEIKPCLISFCRMVVLLWAPVVLFLCIRRLTTPHRHGRCESKVDSEKLEISSKQTHGGCLIRMPMTKRNSLSTDSSTSAANRTPVFDTNKTIDKGTQFFSNFISVLCSSAPIFSIEDQVNKPNTTKSRGLLASTGDTNSCQQCTGVGDPLAYIIAMLVSATIMTDAMYILEFSQTALVSFHILIIAIGMKRLGPKAALVIAMPITCASFFTILHQDLDLPTVQPGLYYSKANPIISKAVQDFWPVESRTYEGRGTPWIVNGDTRTGLPFLLYSPPNVQYIRRWVPLPDEHEAVILDLAFPKSDAIEDDKNVYLIIHGINGHSNEGYVLDFARQQVDNGNIVAVMVTRGLMDSPVIGNNLLHFARTSDVSAAAKALKSAILKIKANSSNDGPMLAGVGYSMGAITMANYVARAGTKVDLDVAIGFSGALDTREQVTFHRSASLWQPLIAKAMRDTLIGKFMKQIEAKFTREQFNEMMRATSLVELDKAFFAPYNGFDGLDDYYSNTGAMGDFKIFNGKEGRIANVSIPLLMVQSLDDPVGTWRSFHEPEKVAATGNGNTVILFTQTGGHVGWPLGLNPRLTGWSWMNDVASSFVDAIGQAHNYYVTQH